jgi:hypothetical protein
VATENIASVPAAWLFGRLSDPVNADWPHLRERGRGQDVTVFINRRSTEASPDSVESLADSESLRQDAEHGYDVLVWHRSTASSTQCYPAGGVDNTARPCRVFPAPLFFTPR